MTGFIPHAITLFLLKLKFLGHNDTVLMYSLTVQQHNNLNPEYHFVVS